MATPAQNLIVKNYVQADQVLSLLPPGGDSADQIRIELIKAASPAWYVFRTNMPKKEVQSVILYANMTSNQTIPANNTAEALQIWIAKCLLAQSKQFNLQNLLLGTDEPSIDFSLPGQRSAFQDCLTGLFTKNDGTVQAAGWGALQLLISRPATIVEKLLAKGTGTQVSPATMGFEGAITGDEIKTAMGW